MPPAMVAVPLRAPFVLLAWLALLAGAAAAQSDRDLADALRGGDQPVTLTADVLEYEAQREVYVARGNVVIVRGGRTLRADWVAFNPETGAGVASGHVELVRGEDTLRADFVEFNVQNLEGIVRGGSLDAPGSRFKTSGEEIEKVGENTYRFRKGVFTTCRCPDPDEPDPWRIRAEEADVEIGGYGTVEDATVEVKDVPILWLPWMIFPIKTERQSGFLLPDLAIGSKNGFGIGVPFFWAVRDEVNLTLTPEWTTKRGFKGAGALEYVFGRESEGETIAAYGHDEDIDPHSVGEPYGRDRWLAKGSHQWFLPEDVRFQTSYAFASDNDVTLDYKELSSLRADRFLTSVASLSRAFGSTGRFGGVASAFYADDQQSPDDVDRDSYVLQRLPEVALSAAAGSIPAVPLLRPSLDAEYVYFDHEERPSGGANGFADTGVDGVFDPEERPQGPGPPNDPHADDAVNFSGGTEGDGVFQEGELLTDAGHRLLLQPRLAAPFRLGRFAEVYPEVGWHQTFYDTRRRGTDQRGLLTGRVDLRSRLRRVFGGDVVHLVEPFAGWAYVSSTSQRNNPLLLPGTALPQERIRSLDLDAVTRDTADRIDRANRLSFGVSQRVFGEGGGGFLEADATLLGIYDFDEDDFGEVVLDGRLAPHGLGSLRFNLGFDTDKVRANEGLAEWGWSHPDGHRVSVAYRYLRDIPNTFEDFGTGDRFDDVRRERHVEQVSGSFRLAVTRQITATYRLVYSFASDLLLGNEGSLEYMSSCECWALGVQVSEDRAQGVNVKLLYRLIGLGKDEAGNPGGLLDW